MYFVVLACTSSFTGGDCALPEPAQLIFHDAIGFSLTALLEGKFGYVHLNYLFDVWF